MAFDPETYAPKPVDPNAPKVLDIDLARKMANGAPKYARLPNGDVMVKIGEQLNCALDELQKGSSSVTAAQNDVMRYQREAETANREVRDMQAQMTPLREERDRLQAEIDALNAAQTVPPGVASPPLGTAPKKRGRPKGNVVQMDHQQKAAQ